MIKNKLKILYEDKFFLIVNKPAGLLCMATDKEKMHTLYHEVLEYLRKKNQKVFIVHRLDKDTSGIVLFAKTEKVKDYMQNNWDNIKRGYVALLEGQIEAKKGTLTNYLAETKTLLTYVTVKEKGKLAITEYDTISSNNKYSLVQINLKTGRKNQIRVQFANINHPIVGDKKYGNKGSGNELALLANSLVFTHPITKEEINISLDIPQKYLNLAKK